MGGGRNKNAAQQSEGGNTDEQDVGMGAQGGQNSEMVQLMKWLTEREEKRREEDKERECEERRREITTASQHIYITSKITVQVILNSKIYLTSMSD